MGRESTITSEQVAAEADSMVADGGKPSARAIRDRLGTGSMGTIQRFLQQWRDDRRAGPAAPAIALPPALQRAIVEFMEQELTARMAPTVSALAEQQQATNELVAEVERQAEQVAGQTDDLARLAEEKAAAEGRAEQLAADLAGARKEAASERQAAEHARTELAKAQLRLEAMPRLEADLAAMRGDLAKEREARTAAEQSTAVLTAQKSDLENRIDAMGRESTKVAAAIERDRVQAEQTAERERTLLARIATLEESKGLATGRAEQIAGLNAEIAELRAKVALAGKTG